MSLRKQFGQLRGVRKALRGVQKQAQEPVDIAVISDASAQRAFLRALRIDAASKAIHEVSDKNSREQNNAILRSANLAVIVVPTGVSNESLRKFVEYAKLTRNVLIVISGRERNEWLKARLSELFDIPDGDTIFVQLASERDIHELLLPRILAKLPTDKDIALAAQVPIFRDLVANQLIRKASYQNGALGAAVFIPGADMAAMTLNQIRMVLQLTAAYNEEVSSSRLTEILAVVAGGFAFRAIARQLVGLVPVAGWAVKGSIGFTGTMAMGQVTKKYLESLENKSEIGEPVVIVGTDRTATEEGRKTQSLHQP